MYQIFSNKLIYVAAIGITLFVLSYPISRYSEINKVFTGREEIETLAEKYMSNEYTVEEINEIRQNARNKIYNKEELNKEEEFLLNYSGNFIKVSKDIQTEGLKEIESRLDSLKGNNNIRYNSNNSIINYL